MVEDTHTSRPSPAETLRRAAALMRERAEAMTGWASQHPEESGGPLAWFTPMFISSAFAAHAPGDATDPVLREGWALDGEHYASWHPAVALAVADLLDDAYPLMACDNCTSSEARCRNARIARGAVACCPECAHSHRVLAVARAYVGGSE